MFEVVHCFIRCWHETVLDGGFCDDLFFYNIQKSLNNCNKVSTNVFLRECSIVHIFIIFYSEFLIIPYIYHSKDPFYSRCNFFIFHCYGMQQLVGVNYVFDCCVTLILVRCYYDYEFLRFLTVQATSLFMYPSVVARTCLGDFDWIKRSIKFFSKFLTRASSDRNCFTMLSNVDCSFS